MPSSFDQLREKVDISGVNRYNPNNIEALQACVEAMVTENKYDKDILTTLLKLYQLNNEKYQEKYVGYVLLKTMMAFPRNDYGITKYLIDSVWMGSLDLRRVFFVGELLESCNFSLFWKILNGEYVPADPDTVDEVLKAPEEIHKMIERIPGFRDPILVGFAKMNGWQLLPDGNTYFIQNHEDTIKSRNIEEKLKFEQCIGLLRSRS